MNESTPSPLPHWPRRPKYGDLIDVEIETISFRKGFGIGTVEALIGPQREHRTFQVIVRKCAPGDHLRVMVEKSKKNQIEGHWIDILAPAAERVSPRCKHFGRREEKSQGCGGCTLQMLSIEDQLRHKRDRLQKLLTNAGHTDVDVLPPISAVAPWNYRNKMEFSFGDDDERNFALGLFPTGYRREILSLHECHLQSEETVSILDFARRWAVERGLIPYHLHTGQGFLRTLTIREGKRTGERMVILTTADPPQARTSDGDQCPADLVQDFCGKLSRWAEEKSILITSIYWTKHITKKGTPTTWTDQRLHGQSTLREEMKIGEISLHFEIHPRAFFQPNTLQAEVLYGEVAKRIGRKAEGAQVLDLYCGTGTISLCMAAMGARTTGVELVAEAVDNARRNAAQNGLGDRSTFLCGDVGTVLQERSFAADAIVVDPPRAGLLPAAIEHLDAVRSNRLVYVSCNPLSLVRDLGELKRRNWNPSAVQPVDMFPHTAHIECVVAFERSPQTT